MRRSPLRALLAVFFRHLYTTFAWAYDAVAWLSSAGQWQLWIDTARSGLADGPLLELGHGPGHLLVALRKDGRWIVGIDSSRQMTRLAKRNLQRNGLTPLLASARAERLPFKRERFQAVLATFPSEYILQPTTRREIWRVLQPRGKLVLIGVEAITGRSLPDRLASALYRLTGQSGAPSPSWISEFESEGFRAQIERLQLPRAVILRIEMSKRPQTVPRSHAPL